MREETAELVRRVAELAERHERRTVRERTLFEAGPDADEQLEAPDQTQLVA